MREKDAGRGEKREREREWRREEVKRAQRGERVDREGEGVVRDNETALFGILLSARVIIIRYETVLIIFGRVCECSHGYVCSVSFCL